MNAAGLNAILIGVSGKLSMPHFDQLVTDGKVKQDELDGTRKMVKSAMAILQKTPHDKIEALVAHYDEQLTLHLENFNAKGYLNLQGSLQDAQMLMGFVSAIFSKARIRE